MNMTERARRLGIKMTAKLSNEGTADDYPQGSQRWDCEMVYRGHILRVPFHMGPALCREPTVGDVLSHLAADCSTYDNSDGFEDWANELGCDLDSRKAERTYNEIGEQRTKVANLLGDAYHTVVFETDPE